MKEMFKRLQEVFSSHVTTIFGGTKKKRENRQRGKFCSRCNRECIYSSARDSYACFTCNTWNDSACSDLDCALCEGRSTRPFPTSQDEVKVSQEIMDASVGGDKLLGDVILTLFVHHDSNAVVNACNTLSKNGFLVSNQDGFLIPPQ